MTGLHIESLGSGSDLALVHGWGFGSAAWNSVSVSLARNFRVHLISLPGYDQAETPVNRRSSDRQPEDTREHCLPEHRSFQATAIALADALPAGCTVCGWSLGAQLAMQAALSAPGLFSRLVLVGATARFTQADDWLHAQPPALLETFCTHVTQDALTTRQRFAALLNQGDVHARANTHRLNDGITVTDAATLMYGLHWLRDVDLRDTVAALTVPVQLIHGEHDPLMPLAAAQWLNAVLPDSTLDVFAGAAHAPFLNDPDRFVSLITHASALH